MPKEGKDQNTGSRGGSSYWTLYRWSQKNVSSRNASNRSQSAADVIPQSSNAIEPSLEYSHDSALFSVAAEPITENDADCQDTGSDVDESLSDDEYINTPILSLEEESSDEYRVDEQKDSSRFDLNSTEIFRNLISRHPQTSNLFVNDMLQCLRTVGLNVPKDARTLLQAPKKPVPLRTVEPGVYWHYGLKKLIDTLLNSAVDLPKSLDILVNIDGLPISASSPANIWPILVTITNLVIKKPFIVGIYYHERTKPKNITEYLKDFVEDLKEMKTQGFRGITINKVSYPLDAPALAFMKEVQYHSGKNSCNKCTIVGETKMRRVCFPSIGHDKRVDSIFRDHTTYGKHHRSRLPGPLEAAELGTDMIMDFLIEPLHALDLGVVKKTLVCWVKPKSNRYGNPLNKVKLKLSEESIDKLDVHLNSIRPMQPSDFNRLSRSISIVNFWKGAEFSCVLHYTGIVVFKNILDEQVYKHFLELHVASTICRTKHHSALLPLTKRLFESYVTSFRNIYGD